ncbi:MAG: virulence factor SrfB [Dysgonamonadaceae bacterium]|jgi:hypothetical protein|nr:virulence factor SrfB [Dysgonamonadaceae bacterium]
MNLIANTGIQMVTVPMDINLNGGFKMFFHEWYDPAEQQLKLEIAHYFSEEDVWVAKRDLAELGYAMNGKVDCTWETIQKDFDAEGKKTITIETDDAVDSGCFQTSISRLNWNKFENLWFPVPFFLRNGHNRSEFGPTNWCRFRLIPITTGGTERKYNLLLAFDTRSEFETDDEELNETPVFTSIYDRQKKYGICNDEHKLVNYCSQASNCGWVDKYILKRFHNIDDINDLKAPKPKLNYLAQYIILLRYIGQLEILPQITLHSNCNAAHSNVDLVVDIGNSRTCAVLFDGGDFTKTSPLELQDFSEPIFDGKLNKHRDPFDMRLAFREADFGGNFGIADSRQFVYPSMIRLGKEANSLIHKATNINTGAEKTSTFSSPKRFLWDTKPQRQEWEFVLLADETAKPIYIKGISEQLNTDGSLNTGGDGGILMHYSRKALMTFAFLEILAQAKMQINSYEQRSHWGNETMPRKIGRIIVTCPTAMSRVEQVALRKCAEDAAIILNRFFEEAPAAIVIPSHKNLSAKEEPAEWIYDEAASAQFVFLYAEIRERYLKNVKEYFEFYGKIRNDMANYNKKSLTIGSVDIGAGTTDVMIAAYKYEDGVQCALIPVPLFWESFYLAGDDLLKELIHQLVIEGEYSPVEKKIRTMGNNPVELMQPFLGTDNGVSFRNRQLRSDFNLQISVPIVSHYLELLKDDQKESMNLSYDDIFANNQPTNNVLEHFRRQFGFEFQSLQWQYDKKTVAAIIEKTFDSLIGKISSLFSYYACDIVLISGRPTSLKPLANLFLKHYAIAPNRLKTMNDYRVGRWYPEDKRYPFIDGNGKFINPKSIVTTGAMIGYRAENGGLNGFSLNLNELKAKLTPKTNYFGILDEQLEYGATIISPETNRAAIEVSSLPLRIGVRQLDISAYPSRPFYTLDFNDIKLEDRILGKLENENDRNAVQNAIDEAKTKIRMSMPLKIIVERDFNDDIEQLRIEEVVDKKGETQNRNFFSLQIQSMSEVENFWLDSGIFPLNIKHIK